MSCCNCGDSLIVTDEIPCHFYGIRCRSVLCTTCADKIMKDPYTGKLYFSLCYGCEIRVIDSIRENHGFEIVDNGPRKFNDILKLWAVEAYKRNMYPGLTPGQIFKKFKDAGGIK